LCICRYILNIHYLLLPTKHKYIVVNEVSCYMGRRNRSCLTTYGIYSMYLWVPPPHLPQHFVSRVSHSNLGCRKKDVRQHLANDASQRMFQDDRSKNLSRKGNSLTECLFPPSLLSVSSRNFESIPINTLTFMCTDTEQTQLLMHEVS